MPVYCNGTQITQKREMVTVNGRNTQTITNRRRCHARLHITLIKVAHYTNQEDAMHGNKGAFSG
jgi:hypothetical protein